MENEYTLGIQLYVQMKSLLWCLELLYKQAV